MSHLAVRHETAAADQIKHLPLWLVRRREYTKEFPRSQAQRVHNYPNPFRPFSTRGYDLETSAPGRITIYYPLGKVAATVFPHIHRVVECKKPMREAENPEFLTMV